MKSKSYWEQRNKDITKLVNPERSLKKLYRQSYKRQREYIDYLYEFAAKQGNPLTRTELYQFSHFLKLKKAIKEECDINLSKLNKITESTLKKAYKETFKNTKYLLDEDQTWTVVNKKRLESCLKTKWSGKHFSTRNVGNYKKLAKSVEEAVVDSIVNGKSKQDCIRAVHFRNNVSYNQAYTLVQTETAYVINKANLDVYKDAGCEEVEILAEINKERCCDKCRSKNGEKVKIKEAKFGVSVPPFHPNCHCDVLPVLK